jgi:cytochrome bd-type quinol oxidase subunit 2
VEVTAGLTYAEYARQGFFELVATATLVLPILLIADWAVAPGTERSRTVLRGTALVLVVLLVGVMASAAYRMRLYQEAYGLTEDRLYVSVFIVWLTAVLGWLVFTVLRGRRERFAFGSIMAGLACIAGLYVVNPHAVIAKVNLDRAAAGKVYDGKYLPTLSADAVPVILARLGRLPEVERCNAVRMLREKWSGARRGGWRTWNLSDWRARRLVAPLTVPATCPADFVAPPE